MEPTLWNTALGRRKFLTTTGAATAGTAITLNRLMFEVLASPSDDVLIWEIFWCGGSTTNSGLSYSTKAEAEAAAKQFVKDMLLVMPRDPNKNPNHLIDKQGNKQPCFVISPPPATPLIQVSGSGSSWTFTITIPAGSVKFVYYK